MHFFIARSSLIYISVVLFVCRHKIIIYFVYLYWIDYLTYIGLVFTNKKEKQRINTYIRSTIKRLKFRKIYIIPNFFFFFFLPLKLWCCYSTKRETKEDPKRIYFRSKALNLLYYFKVFRLVV